MITVSGRKSHSVIKGCRTTDEAKKGAGPDDQTLLQARYRERRPQDITSDMLT
jgi:hypothetical protein